MTTGVTTPTPEPAQPNEGEPQPQQPEAAPLTAEDVAFAEGVEVDETTRDEFLSLLNDGEKGPKERAQALVDLHVKAIQAASEASSKAWTDMQEQWQQEVKADPTFAGDKLEPALGRIGRLINEHGTEELRQVFDMTGAGNSLHVIRFLDKVAGLLTEGTPATGLPKAVEVSAAQKMFPSMKG